MASQFTSVDDLLQHVRCRKFASEPGRTCVKARLEPRVYDIRAASDEDAFTWPITVRVGANRDLDPKWVRDTAEVAYHHVWDVVDDYFIRSYGVVGTVLDKARDLPFVGSFLLQSDVDLDFPKLSRLLRLSVSPGDTNGEAWVVAQAEDGGATMDSLGAKGLVVLFCLGGLLAYLVRKVISGGSAPASRVPPTPAPSVSPNYDVPQANTLGDGAFAVVWQAGKVNRSALKAAHEGGKTTTDLLEIIEACYRSKYLTAATIDDMKAAEQLLPVDTSDPSVGYCLGLVLDPHATLQRFGHRFGAPLRTELTNKAGKLGFEAYAITSKTVDANGFVEV